MRTLEIARWRRERRAFGRIRCTPPEGDELGEIVVHERVRPFVSLRTLVEERTGPAAIDLVRQLATAEGELAAIVSFESAGGSWTLGVVFGDDFQMVVEGYTVRPDQRDRLRTATREVVVHFPLGLGQKRHRRFWYRPPPGWQGLPRGLVSDWYPLDHPRNPATIKVLPARPLDAAFHLDTFFRDDSFAELALDNLSRDPLQLSAFKGTLARATSTWRAFVTAALEDRQYVYILRLTTTVDRLPDDEPIFLDVVRSCVPLPLPTIGPPSMSLTHALDHWAI